MSKLLVLVLTVIAISSLPQAEADNFFYNFFNFMQQLMQAMNVRAFSPWPQNATPTFNRLTPMASNQRPQLAPSPLRNFFAQIRPIRYNLFGGAPRDMRLQSST